MKRINLKLAITSFALLFSAFSFGGPGSVQHSAQASKHSALGSAHLAVGVVEGAATVVALPLIAVGALGDMSGRAGKTILDSTHAYQPLEITDQVITQDPSPNSAMQ